MAWLLTALPLLAACSSDEPPEALDIPSAESPDEAGSGTASPGGKASDRSSSPAGVPAPSPPADEGRRVRDTEAQVHVLQLPEREPARTVAQTYVDYARVRLQAYNTGAVDLAGLAAVAMGEPLTDVQSRVAELAREGLRTVGDLWVRVGDGDVSVRGGRAEIERACLLNASVDVNGDERVVEDAPSAYVLSASARRVAPDTWVIDSQTIEDVEGC